MNEICSHCGQPIHWVPQGTEEGGAWYHDSTADMLACDADETLPATVRI